MFEVTLTPPDEAIDSAFAELDARLSVWVAAVNATQDALAARITVETADTDCRAAAVDDPPVVDGGAFDVASAGDSAHEEPDAIDVADAVAETLAAPILAAGDVTEAAPDEPEPVAEAKSVATPAPIPQKPETSPAAAIDVPASKPAGMKTPPAPAAEVSDDDALLATLDDKTVKILRVRRRLSPVKKSMRELLAELEAEQNGKQESASAAAKLSWWRRK